MDDPDIITVITDDKDTAKHSHRSTHQHALLDTTADACLQTHCCQPSTSDLKDATLSPSSPILIPPTVPLNEWLYGNPPPRGEYYDDIKDGWSPCNRSPSRTSSGHWSVETLLFDSDGQPINRNGEVIRSLTSFERPGGHWSVKAWDVDSEQRVVEVGEEDRRVDERKKGDEDGMMRAIPPSGRWHGDGDPASRRSSIQRTGGNPDTCDAQKTRNIEPGTEQIPHPSRHVQDIGLNNALDSSKDPDSGRTTPIHERDWWELHFERHPIPADNLGDSLSVSSLSSSKTITFAMLEEAYRTNNPALINCPPPRDANDPIRPPTPQNQLPSSGSIKWFNWGVVNGMIKRSRSLLNNNDNNSNHSIAPSASASNKNTTDDPKSDRKHLQLPNPNLIPVRPRFDVDIPPARASAYDPNFDRFSQRPWPMPPTPLTSTTHSARTTPSFNSLTQQLPRRHSAPSSVANNPPDPQPQVCIPPTDLRREKWEETKLHRRLDRNSRYHKIGIGRWTIAAWYERPKWWDEKRMGGEWTVQREVEWGWKEDERNGDGRIRRTASEWRDYQIWRAKYGKEMVRVPSDDGWAEEGVRMEKRWSFRRKKSSKRRKESEVEGGKKAERR